MRVIAGKYKGTKLVSPRGEVRPTTDIVKGSLFSMLTSKGAIAGSRCLDVFCGSGGLGIEALSRGADSCVFSDIDTQNVSANLQKLKIAAQTVRGDFRKTLNQLSGNEFDLIFCDPPYKSGFARIALELVIGCKLLSSRGIMVIEHGSDTEFDAVVGSYVIDSRSFGAATFKMIGVSNEGDIRGNI